MKTICWSLLLAACTAAGCITLPSIRQDEKKPATPPPPRVSKPVNQVPPVTEDQVNEENAPEKLKALRAELDREAEGN